MENIMNRIIDGKVVLIAEIGVNYYDIAVKYGISNMEAAKLMVRKAKEAGIHAVKFQTYKAETLAAKDSPSYWDTTGKRQRLLSTNFLRNLIHLVIKNTMNWQSIVKRKA